MRGPDDWPHLQGAVVVLPGSYNADRVDEVNRFLARLPWVLLFVTSDEESLFPVERLRHPRLVLYVEPDMTRTYDPSVRFLGMQREADTLDVLAEFEPIMAARSSDVFFAGQVTHARRERMREALGDCRRWGMRVETVYTDHFAGGIKRRDYLAQMAAAKLVPCPSGPAMVDSFRLWEALEAGAVPIADARREDSVEGYWQRAFGCPPFPVLDDWAQLPDLCERLLKDWQPLQADVQSWWQRWKLTLGADVDRLISELSDTAPAETLADQITVIVPSSPIEEHPTLRHLDATLDSVQDRLPGCRVIVGFDGVRTEQERLRQRYYDYRQATLASFNVHRHDVYPLVLDEWSHQAGVTRTMLAHVRTPLVLFVEHDCPLVGDVPFDGLADVIRSGEANVVRLAHEADILEPHRHLFGERWDVRGQPLTPTWQWSQRPHLALTAFYRDVIRRYFGAGARTMVEDVMHGVVQQAQIDGAWGMFRLFMFTPDGNIKRSTTTDGRGQNEPKYDMWIEYDGPTPEWAPAPTRDLDEYRQPGIS